MISEAVNTRNLNLLPIAEAEAEESFDWYEQRELGLGPKFRAALKKTTDKIRSNPYMFPVVQGSKVRRALVDDFPYIVVFSVENESILVLSIFHTSRNPMIWRGRTE